VNEGKPLRGGPQPGGDHEAAAAAQPQPDLGGNPGRAVQVHPIKLNLKPPGTKRLKLKCDILLSTSAFKLNLRRYALGMETPQDMKCDSCTGISHVMAAALLRAGAYSRSIQSST
jgi:hypothetical protein